MKENNLKETNDKKEVETSTETVRTGETKYVVARRKPSVFLSIILILIGAVLAALIMLICFGDKIVSNNVEDEAEAPETEVVQEDKEEKVKEIRILNLDPKGDFIQLLYSKIVVDVRNYPVGYGTKLENYDSMDDTTKALYVLRSIKGEEVSFSSVKNKLDNKVPANIDNYPGIGLVTIISLEDANNKYKRYFGADKEISLNDIETGMGYVYEYVAEDAKYYGHYYEGGGGSPFVFDRKITKVEKNADGTEVYIYDSFACALPSTHTSDKGNVWCFYGSKGADSNTIIKDDVLEVYENGTCKYEGKTMKEKLRSYVDEEKYIYKHTFKLDKNGNYCWVSGEPVK